jgi:hypothetical protein
MKLTRNGAKPCRDLALKERDRDLLDDYGMVDVLLYVRKLRGEVPYSMTEVKPVESAAIIESLVRRYDRLRASKSAKALAAMRAELEDAQRELATCHRLMDQWEIAYPVNVKLKTVEILHELKAEKRRRKRMQPRGLSALMGENG